MGSTFLGLAAIVAGAFVLQLANGWLGLLVPLRLGMAGYPASVVGVVVTCHAVGFLVGCLAAPGIVRSVGHIRAFAALAAAASVAALSLSAAVDAVFWGALRLVTGFCSAVLFTIAESWISAQTAPRLRGRVLGLYMISNKVALVGGQLAIAVGGAGSGVFFMLASAAYAISLIPVSLSRGATPKVPELNTLTLRQLFRIAPVGIVGSVAAGLVNGAVIGVTPIYGVEIGLSAATVAVLLSLMQGGSLLLQWPLGWMSDRYERRRVILAASVAAAASSFAIAALGPSSLWALYALAALWGGFALSAYALCLAHAGDFAEPQQMVPLASTLLLVWAAGAVAGPTLATVVMDLTGPSGLFLYSGAVSAALAVFVAWRMTRRRAPPPQERDRFVGVPVLTSPGTAEMDPRQADGG